MAHLANLENVTQSFGTAVLLDGVSLGVADGDRIGVVGRNGAGKTTLLDVLAKAEPAQQGRATHTSGISVGYLRQQMPLPGDETVRDVVLADRFAATHEWAGDARIRAVLDGLGLAAIGLDAPVRPLSGGERRRIALAALLVQNTDLLLLDEPTNHLDVEGVQWLADHLAARRGGLVVVTHDRWFLDAVCDRTWEVEGGSVYAYDGGYSAYVLARAERVRLAEAAESRRQNLLRKELAWLRRGAPARTSKPRFRVDAANALIAGEPPARDTARLRALAVSRLGKQVYDAEDVTVTRGGRRLLDRATWRVGPGDRIGLVGVNGSGKTTALRLLIGAVQPETGRVRVGPTVRAAYLSQEVTELPEHLRVLQAVEEIARVVRVGDRDVGASQLLEMFGFGSSQQWTPVAELSGGERRRLQLLRLLMAEPNALLLDEPTNDLDIDTLTALEDLLDAWPGTLIVVSHDRYLVERVCDTVVALLGDGAVTHLPGGVEDYLQRRRAAASETASDPAESGGGGRTRKGDSRAQRKELTRLERLVAKLESREARLHREMADAATDYERVSALNAELRDVAAERQAAEEAWLHLAD